MKRALFLLLLLSFPPVYADGLLPKTDPQAIEIKMPDGSKKMGFIKDGVFVPVSEANSQAQPQLEKQAVMASNTDMLLPPGTPIQVVLDKEIDSDEVKVGQVVDAHVLAPVKHNGQVVFPAGTPVKGVVTHRKNNSIAGVAGAIELGNFKVVTANGSMVPLSGNFQRKGDSRMAGSLIGAYFILLPIFIKGQDGKVESGAESTLYTVQEWDYTPN